MQRIIPKYFLLLILILFNCTLPLLAAPVITVDKKRIDFGTYPANIRKEHTFKITNTGNETLKIIKVRKTCGCSVAKLGKKELKPGESTTLQTAIKPESIAGPYSKSMFVQNNDPKQRYLMLSLNGNSKPLIKVKPKNKIYAGTLKPGQKWKQEFILETSQPDVTFGKAEIKGIQARASISPQPKLKYKLTVSLTAPDKPNTRFFIKLNLPITTPSNWKPIEITIMGKTTKHKSISVTKRCHGEFYL